MLFQHANFNQTISFSFKHGFSDFNKVVLHAKNCLAHEDLCNILGKEEDELVSEST